MSSDFIESAIKWLRNEAKMDEAVSFYRTLYSTPGCDSAALAELGRNDRFFLLTHLLGRLDIVHPWLYARCREVESAPNGHLDLWARDHRKSTIITYAGSIQEILKNPEITIGIFSHTRPIAKAFLIQIQRELEVNDTLKALYPDVLWSNPAKEAPVWSQDAGIVVKRKSNPKESTVEAWGLVDAQPTSRHFRLRIYDDVVTLESVSTPEQVNKTTNAWELSDNLGTQDGWVWTIGTRYSFADTYHSMMERGALKPRLYPATDDGTPNGKPVFLTDVQWAEKKLFQSPAVIACQMLQNPIAGAQAMFDVKWLQPYDIRPATLNVYVLIDPARSQKKDSANTAMVAVGVDQQSNKWLLDGYNHKMPLSERWERMKTLRKKWLNEPGVQSVRVGYEVYGAQADMDYFQERMTIERNGFPIDELAWPRDGDASKLDRVQRLQPDMKMGRIYIPMTVDGVTSNQQRMIDAGQPYRVAKPIRQHDNEGNIYDLVEQFRMQVGFFPFGGLKDLVDAFSRIYDIEPVPPKVLAAAQTEPPAFMDS
jgi:hypothetical protein